MMAPLAIMCLLSSMFAVVQGGGSLRRTLAAGNNIFAKNDGNATLAQTLEATKNVGVFQFLIGLVGASDLLESTEFSRTVFVPTDKALQNIPEKYMQSEFHYHLKSLLENHFTDNFLRSTDFADGTSILTLNNETVTTDIGFGGSIGLSPAIYNASATVVQFDVTATNGVAHVINDVIKPFFFDNAIVSSLQREGNFDKLLQAINLAESLTSVLNDPSAKYTLLAPSDLFFFDLDVNTPTEIANILQYHVLDGIYPRDFFQSNSTVMSISGLPMAVQVVDNGSVVQFVGGNGVVSRLQSKTFPSSNGIVHTVNAVLRPPSIGDTSPVPGFARNDSETSSNVPSVLETLQSTHIANAIELAGLTLTLNGDGPFTVFAPSNAAFARLPPIYMSPAYMFHLQDLVLYHVFSGQATSELLRNGTTTVGMGNGEFINVTTMGEEIYFSPSMNDAMGAMLQRSDTTAQNGVVHIISDILAPRSAREGVLEVAERTGLTAFLRALDVANLTSLLDDPFASFTIFAPSNTAFTTFEGMENLLSDPVRLAEVLSFHILSKGVVPTTLLGNGTSLLPLSGGSIFTGVEDETITLTGINMTGFASISAANIPAKNGIIHVIDTLLVPHTPSLLQLLSNTTMASLIETANLTEEFDADGPQTVLVPRNEVFEPLLEMFKMPAYMFHLRDILLYHLLPDDQLDLADFKSNSTLEMGNGAALSVDVDGILVEFSPSLTGTARLAVPGFEANNGIAHSISDILTPPSATNDLASMARQLGLGTLLTAFDSANLTSMLQDSEEVFTLLAPTDMAFSRFSELDNLIDDPLALSAVLGVHLLEGVIPSTLLESGTLRTVTGDELDVTVDGDQVTFYGSNAVTVTRANIPANNGIIHLLDSVLLPKLPELLSDTIANTSLGEAMMQAGLTERLQEDRNRTLIRPTDAALTNLPSKFFDPLYRFHLKDILEYHIAQSTFGFDANTNGRMLAMSNGESISVSLNNGGIASLTPSLTGTALVEISNQVAINGIFHIINDVMTPFSLRNSAPKVAERAGLATFMRALDRVNLTKTLSDPDRTFTIFAPSDMAFETADNVDTLFSNTDELRRVLEYHIIDAMIPIDGIPFQAVMNPLLGQALSIEVLENGRVTLSGTNEALAVRVNIPANNAIIHVIDTVLVPTSGGAALLSPTVAPGRAGEEPSNNDRSFSPVKFDAWAIASLFPMTLMLLI